MKVARAIILPIGAILLWGMSFSIKAVTALLGALTVPLMYRYRYTNLEKVPSIFLPWLNPEDWQNGTQQYDGSLPTWWIQRMGDGFWAFYKYHAIRNPADGLRNFKLLNCQINPDKIEFVTDKFRKFYEPWWRTVDDSVPRVQWYICWQGVWAGVKLQWIRKKTYTEFKLGFRIEPNDTVDGPDPNGSRALHGASFASKLILNREHNG